MLSPCFQPFPVLTTQRLLLRKITNEDTPEVFFMRSDPTMLQYVHREPVTSLQEAKDFITRITTDIDTNTAILWGIALQENPAVLIGNICYWRLVREHHRAEIGYMLHPGYWKKGIMKETLLKVLDYGFNVLQLHSVEARIDPANTASAALLEAAGFVREAYFKEDFLSRGIFMDTAVYSLVHTKKTT
jgi:[ribosomal protein S5]-alanine N-acetyltransferase